VWELWVRLGHVKPLILPSFSASAKAMYNHAYFLLPDLWITFKEVIYGLALSVAIGIPLAILIVYSKTIEYALYPLLVASQVIPKLAIAPIFIVWFGFGSGPKAWLVFSLCFFPIVIESVLGFRSTEREKLYLARSMGASEVTTFRIIRVPQALPYIFTGLKLAATFAVIGAVVAEFVGADAGIGHRIVEANQNLDTVDMIAATAYITLLGFAMFAAVEVLERMVLPWHASRREAPSAT
jgi:NitT/TauT family transport system permease protein